MSQLGKRKGPPGPLRDPGRHSKSRLLADMTPVAEYTASAPTRSAIDISSQEIDALMHFILDVNSSLPILNDRDLERIVAVMLESSETAAPEDTAICK